MAWNLRAVFADVDRLMPWWQCSFDVAESDAEFLQNKLDQTEAISVSLSAPDQSGLIQLEATENPLWTKTRVDVLFPIESSLKELREILSEFDSPNIDVTLVADQDWATSWRQGIEPLKFGKLWVVPRDADTHMYSPCVRLDPGLAFGTGTHPTTALCLNWLASLDLERKSVLDFGCGSGILGIAAKKLGANHVTAVDNDAQALSASEENAEFNEVEIEILDALPRNRSYDVVVTNILLTTLFEHEEQLSSATRDNGQIGLSGLLREQEAAITSAYHQFRFSKPRRKEEWILMTGNKLSPAT